MQIDIRVTEILSRVIAIDSSSIENAILTVEDMYENEDIVLDYNDYNGDTIIEKKKITLIVKKIY